MTDPTCSRDGCPYKPGFAVEWTVPRPGRMLGQNHRENRCKMHLPELLDQVCDAGQDPILVWGLA